MAKFLHLIKVMLVTGFVTGIFQNLNAQQTLQRITYNENETIIELFQIRNGNINYNVVGNGWYDQGMSQYTGSAISYLESTNQVYNTYDGTDLTPSEYPVEQIGNGTFQIASPQPYGTNKSYNNYDWKDADGNDMPYPELTIHQDDTDRDALEDSNEMIDMLHTKWFLPHSFNESSPLPEGLWIILLSREGEKETGGSHASLRIGFRWNGSAWVQQVSDPTDDPFDVLQNADLAIFSVALTPNPAEGGNVSGNGDYQEGSFAAISATPNEGFQFVHWKNTANGNVISTQNPYNFQVLENLNIEAVFQNNMSINDTETTKSMVFPNPAKTTINITNPKNGSSELKIFSSAGQFVKSVNFENEEKITVPVNDLPKGVYIIKVGNVSSKFIKD